jgi:hypothetical protein
MAKKRQLGVALDDWVREELEKAAARSGRSLADEIRHRVERTFQLDAIAQVHGAAAERERSIEEEVEARLFFSFVEKYFQDPKTQELENDIARIARIIWDYSGHPWHQHPKSHAALAEAIRALLVAATPPALKNSTKDKWDDPDDPLSLSNPQTVGRMAVQVREHEKREQAARQHLAKPKGKKEKGS